MAMFTALALLLGAQVAGPSGATTATPAPTPQDSARAAAGAQIQASAQAFSACLGPKVPTVAPALTPEQGADSVIAACKTEKTALETSVETMIATLPADRQGEARQRLTANMDRARAQIAAAITQMRANPAAPPAPAPASPAPGR